MAYKQKGQPFQTLNPITMAYYANNFAGDEGNSGLASGPSHYNVVFENRSRVKNRWSRCVKKGERERLMLARYFWRDQKMGAA